MKFLKNANGSSRRLSDSNLLLVITIAIFVVMYICAVAFIGSGFTKVQTFFNILFFACNTLVSFYYSVSHLRNDQFYISVGAVTALVCMCCAMNLDYGGGNVVTSVLIALGIGTAFGLVQGYLIAYLEIQPFIVTLAGMFFAKGMTTIVNATQFNVENEEFRALKETRISLPGIGSTNKHGVFVPAYIEIGVVVALLIVAILFVFLKWGRLGRGFYAIGGNSQSANMLGINVKRTKFFAYLMCGVLAGIGGFVYFLHVGSGSPSHASGAEMNAIASSIIGGPVLSGGSGNIIGTLFGVISLSTIKNIVSSLGLDDAWWTNITVAAMICLFLVIQSVVLSRKNKKKA